VGARDLAADAPHGISLARYAAVMAAVAEPFPRGRVLALEEIDPEAFLAAEIVWKQRLARRDGPVFGRFALELAAAEDWLIRRVTPLYQEPEAWAAFLAAMRAQPARVLEETGLGSNDFARLSRHWARLAREDRGLAADVADHLGRGPSELPRIVAEPRRLRRSRVFQPRVRRGAPAEAAPPEEARVIAPVPEIAPEGVVARAPPPAAPPPAAEEHGTAALPAISPVREAPPLPFTLPRPSEEHRTAALPAIDVARAALPFTGRAVEEHGTAALPAIRADRAPLPFAPKAVEEHRSQALPAITTGRAPSPFTGRAVEEHRTQALPAITTGRAPLPFAPKTVEEHRTQALPAITTGRAPLPFAPKTVEEHGTQALPAIRAGSPAPPVGGRAAPSGDVAPPSPAFTLEQYASLAVDLSRDPARRAETLARYRISEAQRAALDAAWAARFSRDPGARPAFDRACSIYLAMLARAGR
jgi:hypothetical protein